MVIYSLVWIRRLLKMYKILLKSSKEVSFLHHITKYMRFKKFAILDLTRNANLFHPNFASFMIELRRRSAKLLIYLNVM